MAALRVQRAPAAAANAAMSVVGNPVFGAIAARRRGTRFDTALKTYVVSRMDAKAHLEHARRMHLPYAALVAASLVASVGLSACGSPLSPVETPSSRALVSAPASSKLHLRSTPDEDPSRFLGAFVRSGARPEDISEADAVRTRCSASFRIVRVPASQELDESFVARKQARASIGLPVGIGADGATASRGALRIHYRTTEKMVVEVDAAALGRCCRAAPSECTDTIVSEFVRASGEVFTSTGSEESGGAGFTHAVGSAGVRAESAREWRSVSRFENTYFAFGTRTVSLPASTEPTDPSACSFCSVLPTSLDGKYFCGISEPAPTEASARASAMANAREQVVVHLAETLSVRSTLGPLSSRAIAEKTSSGLVSGVKDERWCPVKATSTSEGPRYESRVLAFVPKATLSSAASDAVLGVIEARRKAGTLSADQERELRAMAARLSRGEDQ